jgi:hypothetical protein
MRSIQEDIAFGELTVPVTEGRHRVVVEGVRLDVDCGRFPIKRVVGEAVAVKPMSLRMVTMSSPGKSCFGRKVNKDSIHRR